MYIDYRGQNKLMVKNHSPLSLILGLLDQFGQAKIYKNITLRGTYNLVHMKEGDDQKMAFCKRYGYIE